MSPPSMFRNRVPVEGEVSSLRANGLFVDLYVRVPNKEPSHEKRGKHLVTIHGAPRGQKAHIQWGATSFPKGVVYDTAIPTPEPC
jgi:hypothetical protein